MFPLRKKLKEVVYGCGERAHADGRCGRGRCRGQEELEMDDALWWPVTGRTLFGHAIKAMFSILQV